MEQHAVIVLLISGLCTFCSCLSPQYHFVNIQKSWTEAQSYCRENHIGLATIDNPEEITALMEAIDNGYNGDAWIGLYDDTDSWQWSLVDSGFYSEEATEFRPWLKGQPNNIGSNHHCVSINSDGKWNDLPCDASFSLPYICYDGDSAQRYILFPEKKAWTDAQSYCREHHTDLASVRIQTENQEIAAMIKVAYSKGLITVQHGWIGLFREAWEWSDQSNSPYRRWNSGQPDNAGGNQNCAAVSISDSGRWSDYNCNKILPFFCYDDNLILVHVNKSWDEALSFCRQHYGDLVSVPTEQVQHWVKRRAPNASTAHVWLGLRFSCALKFWLWVSGESMRYQNWAPGNGTGECGHRGAVESGAGQQWVSLPKTETELNFICSKCEGEGVCDSTVKDRHVLRMKLNTNSALNMNDPAVAELILQQMKVKLADEGITGVKLMWRKQSDGKIFHRVEEEGKEEGCKNMEV
ncbi:hypothetical protein AAFF_G00263980 [Aldrovandia affinis]|uniref:C-type lectin domain-containing protein n=1 Tax=Aldrovandia affinis TaxID=143900 RepID=A0AAD7SSW5_9TELE|nr:hypothetical protein AAFF_G00263980 [Aldrovandia affinis]